MTEVVKWLATLVLIVGTAVNGLGYYPEGPSILVVGGFMWLFVAVRVGDWPLIITNLVMSSVGLAAILYTMNAQDKAFDAMGQAQELRQQLKESNDTAPQNR